MSESTLGNTRHTQEAAALAHIETAAAEVIVRPVPEQSIGEQTLTFDSFALGRRVGSLIARYGLELMGSRMPNGQRAKVISKIKPELYRPLPSAKEN